MTRPGFRGDRDERQDRREPGPAACGRPGCRAPPSPCWPRRAAAASLASAPSSASAPTYAQELALAQCMRGHGVPNFPDPSASGGYTLTSNGSIEGAGGSSTSTAARSRRPTAIAGTCCPAARPSRSWSRRCSKSSSGRRRRCPALVKFAQCMRGHGVPNFPDPAAERPERPAPGNGGAVNPDSPQFQAAVSGLPASAARPGAAPEQSAGIAPATSETVSDAVSRPGAAGRAAAARSRWCWSPERGRDRVGGGGVRVA